MPAGYKLNVQPSAADHPLKRIARLVVGSPHELAPESMWLSGWFPGVRDQGAEGSCTGHGGSGFREVLHGSATRNKLKYRLAPADLYFRTRQMEGTYPDDSGCTVADMMAALQTWGVCREELFPYHADPAARPSNAATSDAKLHRIGRPLSVACTEQAFKTVLAAGMPIVVGMPVGRSFLDVGPSGTVPYPPADEKPEGGHCVFLVGYNSWGLMGVNSWGEAWGDNGFFYVPWGYQLRFWEAWTAPLVA